MNIAFDISPFLTASGTFGDKSGVYRYMYGLISSMQKYLAKKDPKAKIILFTFNHRLLVNILNSDIIYLSNQKNCEFLNKFIEYHAEPRIGTSIKQLAFRWPFFNFVLRIANKLFQIKKFYQSTREQAHMRTYIVYLNHEFKKNKVKIIFHSETSFFPLKGYKNIITIYDLTPNLFPHFHRPEAIDLYNRKMEFGRNYCDGIICISNSTKNDLLKYHRSFKNKKIVVVYPGHEMPFYPAAKEKKSFDDANLFLNKLGQSLVKKKYLLHFGTFEPRKNLTNLVKSFSDLQEKKQIPGNFKLVLIGGEGWGEVKKRILEYIKENYTDETRSNIIVLNFLSDQYLYALIKNAFAVVYPSFYEGFGLPVLESMKIGTPVISAKNSSLSEVGKDAVLYFDTNSYFDLEEKIRKLINNKNLAVKLTKKGIEQSKNFSWDRSVGEVYQFLNNLIKEN